MQYNLSTLMKVIWYTPFFNYHVKKQNKISMEYFNVQRFHFEMSKHYYEKMYGEKFKL